VHEASLTFFVSKAKLSADDAKSPKKKNQAEQAEQGYVELSVKLDGLRADISHQLRQRHYTEAVRALIDALDQATIELEDRDGASFADKSGMSDFRN